MGVEPFEQAMIGRWIRRVEFRVWAPMTQVWGNDDPRTGHVVRTRFADFGAHNRSVVADAMTWIDSELTDGRPFLAGEGFSMADIVLLCAVDFAKFVRMPIPDGANNLLAWHQRVGARPTARA